MKLFEKLNIKDIGWNDQKIVCIEAAKEVCGEKTDLKQRRITWWWVIEVKKKNNKRKRNHLENGKKDKTDESKEIYKLKAKEANREVRKSKNQAWQEWCNEIEKN